MTEKMTEIEGLFPWVESGDLGRILASYASWLDGGPDGVEAEMTIRQWDVSRRPEFHLRPRLQIDLTFGPKGYRGMATIEVWRGADADAILRTLDEAVEAAAKAHKTRKSKGSLHHVPATKFVLPPEAGES